METPTRPDSEELSDFVCTEAPRSRDRIDPLDRKQVNKLARSWLQPLVCLTIGVPVPLIIAATQDMDTLGWGFLGTWEIATILIALWLYVSGRRRAVFLDRLLADGEAHSATIVEMIHIKKEGRTGRFYRVRAELSTPDGPASSDVQVSLAVAALLEIGTSPLVVVHDKVPVSLWVFLDGLPPVLGTGLVPPPDPSP